VHTALRRAVTVNPMLSLLLPLQDAFPSPGTASSIPSDSALLGSPKWDPAAASPVNYSGSQPGDELLGLFGSPSRWAPAAGLAESPTTTGLGISGVEPAAAASVQWLSPLAGPDHEPSDSATRRPPHTPVRPVRSKNSKSWPSPPDAASPVRRPPPIAVRTLIVVHLGPARGRFGRARGLRLSSGSASVA
jgi:hypothetical protein